MFRPFLPLLPLLWLAAAATAQHVNPRMDVTRADVEGMYALAKATLEDSTITRMENVPMLLDTCTRHGYAPAAHLLLDVYEGRFKGLAADPTRAAELAQRLADAPLTGEDGEEARTMQTEAMYRMALYLERGYGVERQDAEAFRRMSLAAATGMPEARAEQARMISLGKGTTRDLRQAWDILTEVARTAPQTPHVFFYLGYVSYSTGTRAGRRRAADIFYIGAKHNDADCLNNLGAMFEKGIAVSQDSAKALSLYGKAAALGNRKASANMQRLAYKEGVAAHRGMETPALPRILNAMQHVIFMLPINDKSQQRLWTWVNGTLAGQ